VGGVEGASSAGTNIVSWARRSASDGSERGLTRPGSRQQWLQAFGHSGRHESTGQVELVLIRMRRRGSSSGQGRLRPRLLTRHV
jgi:hypothetical protein